QAADQLPGRCCRQEIRNCITASRVAPLLRQVGIQQYQLVVISCDQQAAIRSLGVVQYQVRCLVACDCAATVITPQELSGSADGVQETIVQASDLIELLRQSQARNHFRLTGWPGKRCVVEVLRPAAGLAPVTG